ncbi:MAG TPA: hypothetical protein DIW77_17565 [Chromatiaceae bacterium]|nr:MAG: hypothetical protein N838_34310 [Thiohalocapsa sp. PB-PSB1]HCS91798.1 hypothetical protein [Chromatiaceae bacterium]
MQDERISIYEKNASTFVCAKWFHVRNTQKLLELHRNPPTARKHIKKNTLFQRFPRCMRMIARAARARLETVQANTGFATR